MYLENLHLGLVDFPIALYCMTLEKTPVNVNIASPLWPTPKVNKTDTVVDGVATKMLLDSSLRTTGSGVSGKGIHITASAKVGCFGANKETLSNDGYLALPVDALGTDFYAVVHSQPAENSEIGVVATSNTIQL